LGQIYLENKDYLNAEVNLRRAINVSSSNKDACCNLGILLLEIDQTDEAIHLFTKVLDLDSKYTKAFFNLGNAYMKIKAITDAISNFEKVLLIEPAYFQAHNNLGNAYKLKHKYKKAIECYQKAIVLKADYSDAYFNLANTYRDIKDFQTAIVNYLKAIEINPKNCDARFNIADVLRKSGKIDKAIEQYKIVLELRPNWASAKHMLNSLIGSDATSVPSKYITDVFDHYAPNFDNSLLNELKYVAPIKLIEKLQSNDQDLIFNNAVELGCGTGLLGEHLVRFCQTLIGVDISKKMLDVAKAKNIYDNTINMDISEFLMQDSGVYDLYIAADVFIYVGDLEPIFDLIARRSGHRKYLAFSTEHCDGTSFELQKSGRFAHSKNYIEQLCKQYKFNLNHVSVDDLREESGIPVLGGYYIATR